MAYSDGTSVARFYFSVDLGSSPGLANDFQTYGIRSDLSAGLNPTTGYSQLSLTPYYYSFISMTAVDFSGSNAGATIDEDPERGWYFEIPFEPLDASQTVQPIDPTDPSDHTPVLLRTFAYDVVAVGIGVYSNGAYQELGYQEVGASYPLVEYVDLIAVATEPSEFWTAFNKTREILE